MHGVLRNILLKCVLQHELQCEYTYLCVCVCNLCMYGVLRNTHTFRGPKLGTYSDWGLSSVLLINKHLSHHTVPTLIIISKTPELKKLGTWKLVADALKKTPLGPVRDGFVLPVLP